MVLPASVHLYTFAPMKRLLFVLLVSVLSLPAFCAGPLKVGGRVVEAALPPSGFPVNFLTDNDITGGNSGSPVLNARGELIGLAFDGNKELLASNFESVDGYNKCVCVDIRYILWILRHYVGTDYVLKEII